MTKGRVEQYPLINSSLREGIHERQAFRRDSIRCYPVRNFLSGSDRVLIQGFEGSLLSSEFFLSF